MTHSVHSLCALMLLVTCVACGDAGKTASSDAPFIVPEQTTVPSEASDTSDESNRTQPEDGDALSEVELEAPDTASMDARLDMAFEYLTGLFDSQAQSRSDLSYFNVQLAACEVLAPELGERVLYLEQAMVRDLSSPYRQRLYVIRDNGDERVASDVYTIYNDAAWVGLCSRDEVANFTEAEVSLRQGCTVYLTQQDDTFQGGTEGERCRSTLGGARYAVSEVELSSTQILSWDRGFDANGVQVWGAEAGPYEFLRQTVNEVIE